MIGNTWNVGGSALPDYNASYTYDANGNILSLNRNASAPNLAMDALTYHYKPNTNQLEYVNDGVTATAHTNDIDDQLPGNYSYDAIGNLVQDNAEEIQNIEWTVYGKISRIERNPTSDKADLEFEYTPDGHRSLKRVYHKNTGGGINFIEETYYIRDASGNIMTTYTLKNQDFTWREAPPPIGEQALYGSSRLGNFTTNTEIIDAATVKTSLPLLGQPKN